MPSAVEGFPISVGRAKRTQKIALTILSYTKFVASIVSEN